jgi:PhnB protein
MPVQVYFNFDHQSLEVMKFYSEVFNSPYRAMFVSEESTQVLHGAMTLLDTHVSFSDIPDGYDLVIGNHITLSINTTDLEQLTTLYHRLSVGGTILTPLGPTFWSDAYGIVEDKFKTIWQLNLDK